ncbi:hypothetical protein D3C71_1745500 [compost metagenome]
MLGACAEHGAVQFAEQVSLAVVAQAAAVGVDQLHAVVERAVIGSLRVAVDDRDAVRLGDFHHGHGRRAIVGFGQPLDLRQANVVATEEHLRAHQQLCPTLGCELRLMLQPL